MPTGLYSDGVKWWSRVCARDDTTASLAPCFPGLSVPGGGTAQWQQKALTTRSASEYLVLRGECCPVNSAVPGPEVCFTPA